MDDRIRIQSDSKMRNHHFFSFIIIHIRTLNLKAQKGTTHSQMHVNIKIKTNKQTNKNSSSTQDPQSQEKEYENRFPKIIKNKTKPKTQVHSLK